MWVIFKTVEQNLSVLMSISMYQMAVHPRLFGVISRFLCLLNPEDVCLKILNLFVYRKGDIVKQPMKKDSFVPKNVPGVGWGGVGWGGVGHVGVGGVGWGGSCRGGVGWVM